MMKIPVRIVTAAALFDGHDAAINVIRRVLQDLGAEVIHLGHNRSVDEVAEAVVQEAAQGVCISSYQGGHVEYFKYLKDALAARGAPWVKIFGGGGGVIVHEEKDELEAYGIAGIFHPDDGRRLGLEGMGRVIVDACAFDPNEAAAKSRAAPAHSTALGLAISAIEAGRDPGAPAGELAKSRRAKAPPVLGVTGTGGAGKSSLVDELVMRFKTADPEMRIGVVCVDPSKRRTGGALLGDRIRMNSLDRPGVFMRSQAARDSGTEIAATLPRVLEYLKQFDFDLLVAESSGIGQASSKITDVSDLSLYVMTPEFGAPSQLEKIDMVDLADYIAINKADRRGAADAHRDVVRQYRRSHPGLTSAPVFLTQASNFNDRGVNELFAALASKLERSTGPQANGRVVRGLIPSERQNYLAEIAATIRRYKDDVHAQAEAARTLGALAQVSAKVGPPTGPLGDVAREVEAQFGEANLRELAEYHALKDEYGRTELEYGVRDQKVTQTLARESLGGLVIPRVVVPELADWGERWRYLRLENVPGRFPFTAGAFPLKRVEEEPTRQFAGEGSPQKTNRRFHYLSDGEAAKRLSTAFDSVTLYGEDPAPRPDIFGKVGESGVSVATLDDVKELYAGFDLCDPATSVSMTINGPAPMLLAFYLNAAVDQQLELAAKAGPVDDATRERIRRDTLARVRGTVQADILKEDQGQNTCIFSIDFALKLMADVQEYFVREGVRNFYSVSISGYHIAEAGAHPVTQLALTLANAFTYVEYYLARGLKIDDFAPNLSFFFSNGLDPEYAVIGRVARRIWAIALRERYRAAERSQKLKYHVQTSGRSLHAQEIAFNDVRTTLQAFLAVADQCNSLHTNAYDEAITTPTEESVRRAKAIQLIINKEFGLSKNENPLQGSYFIERLTDAVENAVLEEFARLDQRGGVLGAMETQYQRGRIQDESMRYEQLKHDGGLPIVGVNTFVDPKTLAEGYRPPKIEMARATRTEKDERLARVDAFRARHAAKAKAARAELQTVALAGGNVFAALMDAARVCTLGQMTHALFDVGGRYRRNV